MKVFRVLLDGTILHVVLLGVLEAEFEVLSGHIGVGVLCGFYPSLISSRTIEIWLCW